MFWEDQTFLFIGVHGMKKMVFLEQFIQRSPKTNGLMRLVGVQVVGRAISTINHGKAGFSVLRPAPRKCLHPALPAHPAEVLSHR